MKHSIVGIAIALLVMVGVTKASAGAPNPDLVVGDCGTAHAEPGCSDAICEQCVCSGFDSTCCSEDWDSFCVEVASGLVKKKAKKGDGATITTCEYACLTANRLRAPALSPTAMVAAAFGLLALVFLATRRRTRSAPPR